MLSRGLARLSPARALELRERLQALEDEFGEDAEPDGRALRRRGRAVPDACLLRRRGNRRTDGADRCLTRSRARRWRARPPPHPRLPPPLPRPVDLRHRRRHDLPRPVPARPPPDRLDRARSPLMSILVALPPVTIGLFAGAWADRHDRRRIMIASDSLRARRRAGLVRSPRRTRTLPARCSPSPACRRSSARSSRRRAWRSSRASCPPRACSRANSLEPGHDAWSPGVIGAAVTGVIAATAGVAWPVFVVDAATFLVSVVARVRRHPRARAPRRPGHGQGADPGPGRRGRGRPAGDRRAAGRSSPRSAACRS